MHPDLPSGQRGASNKFGSSGRPIILELRPSISVEGAKQYFKESLRTNDYFARDAKESPGYWYGNATHLLGLQPRQEITEEDFVAMLENRRPDNGERLTPRNKKDRIPGYEARFDMNKSVSVMALYDPEIIKLFKESVHETLSEMEQHIRVRYDDNGNKTEAYSGNQIAGLFYHNTSRPVDGVPCFQPHVHAYIMNASHDGDRFVAARFREMKHRFFQEFFDNALATKLIARGYDLEMNKHGFEIANFPKTLSEKFSRRKQQIEQYMKEHGLSGRAGQEIAWQATRQDKPKDPMSTKALYENWGSRADRGERRGVGQILKKLKANESTMPRVSVKDAVIHSIKHNFERSSVVEEKSLLADAVHYGRGRIDAEDVKRVLRKSGLLFGEYKGRQKATLPEYRDAEGDVLNFAEKGRGQFDPLGGYGTFQKPKDEKLNKDQIKAIKQIVTTHDQVMVLRGSAGTGKSTLLKTAIANMQEGTSVFAFAPTTQATELLQQDGFEANTLQMLLKNPELQAEIHGSLVIVDEAGLIGIRDMRELTKLIQSTGSRLLLVGDPAQHGPVSAGRPFSLLLKNASLPVMEVRKIVRQQSEAYRNVVSAVDQGDAAGGLQQLDDLGWVMEEKDDAKRYEALARDYVALAKSAPNDPKKVLTIAPTHIEKNAVTDAIRNALRSETVGKGSNKKAMLGKEEHTLMRLVPTFATEAERGNVDFLKEHIGSTVKFYQNAKGKIYKGTRAVITDIDKDRNVWVRTDAGRKRLPTETPGRYQLFETSTIDVAVGERLRITDNGKTKQGGKISNGNLVTVKGFTDRGDLILDTKKTLPSDFSMLDYGYSTTSVSAQGRTIGTLLLAQSSRSYGASFINQWLVSISRARHATKVYTDSKESLSEAVKRRDEDLSATDFLAATRPKQPEAKTTADAWQEHTLRRHRIGSLLRDKLRRTVEHVRRHAKDLQRGLLREERNMIHER